MASWAIRRTLPSLQSSRMTTNPLYLTRRLCCGSLGHIKDSLNTIQPKSLKAPTNPLNPTRQLHRESLGFVRDQTHTEKPTSARKSSKPHQTPTPWVLGHISDYNLIMDSTWAHNPLNNNRHLHCKSLGYTRDNTLAADSTSTHT